MRFKSFAFLLTFISLAGCETELMRKQAAQLRQQDQELAEQRKEIEALKLAQKQETEKREACNRAFRQFEQAQAAKDARAAAELYRQGIALCPEDDVGHYELGKILVTLGDLPAAQYEFETALKINPNFTAAKTALEELPKKN
ncbi:MAG: tetratricopeptide repeat protein [Candidatus Binatia bacterium]